MAIFRQYIAPLLVVLIFFAALVAVSARIFLPSDMAAPAPVDDISMSMIPQVNITINHTAMTETVIINTVTTSPPIG